MITNVIANKRRKRKIGFNRVRHDTPVLLIRTVLENLKLDGVFIWGIHRGNITSTGMMIRRDNAQGVAKSKFIVCHSQFSGGQYHQWSPS